MKWDAIINETVEQIKAEYIFVSKKSVVDFVLGKSLENIHFSEDGNDASQRSRCFLRTEDSKM